MKASRSRTKAAAKKTPGRPSSPAPRWPAAAKPPRALPPALAANARALKERAQARLKARGEAALERIREKLTDVAENILDIGAELTELAAPGVAQALGYANFDAVCQETLDIHPKTAERWMALATNLKRQFVLSVGIDRARALMELADATPADDVPEELLDATLTLPSGTQLVVTTATNAALDEAAKEFRQAATDASGKKAPGFTTSPAERKAHAQIVKHLARAPAAALAKTRLVAQRDGKGARVVLEARLPEWDAVVAALARK
jgi:hypothetical protein